MNENGMHGRVLSNANGTGCKPSCVWTGQRTPIGVIAIVVVLLVMVETVAPLYAQPYPSRPVRLIIPVAPGSGADIVGRIAGQKLAEQVGQPVVPENRAGAGGNIGIEVAARARPDGYTIIIVTGGITISPSIYAKLNYDPIKDFAPIAMLGRMQNLLLVSPSLPVKTLNELVEYAKTNPGKLRFGSSGVGTPGHLASELFKSLAKIDMVHVPYKGLSESMVGVVNGEVHMMVSNVSTAMPQLQSGKIRALAVLSNERVSSLPDVPTGREAGIDNWEVIVWWGFLAPAGTPRDIVNRLSAEFTKIVAMPETKEKLQNAGVEPVSGTPKQLSEFMIAEIARWAKVIKEANIKTLN